MHFAPCFATCREPGWSSQHTAGDDQHGGKRHQGHGAPMPFGPCPPTASRLVGRKRRQETRGLGKPCFVPNATPQMVTKHNCLQLLPVKQDIMHTHLDSTASNTMQSSYTYRQSTTEGGTNGIRGWQMRHKATSLRKNFAPQQLGVPHSPPQDNHMVVSFPATAAGKHGA